MIIFLTLCLYVSLSYTILLNPKLVGSIVIILVIIGIGLVYSVSYVSEPVVDSTENTDVVGTDSPLTEGGTVYSRQLSETITAKDIPWYYKMTKLDHKYDHKFQNLQYLFYIW